MVDHGLDGLVFVAAGVDIAFEASNAHVYERVYTQHSKDKAYARMHNRVKQRDSYHRSISLMKLTCIGLCVS